MWVMIFTHQFCGRPAAGYEVAIIGMSIWLVYTADRLFDSLRLDASVPHSLRHRFHHDHRGGLTVAWMIVLAMDTGMIVRFANEQQLRWGLIAVGLAIAYVWTAQFWRAMDRRFPKEFQIGIVFAFGTSLVAWSESPRVDRLELLIATTLAAVLFALNCLAIGIAELELDSQQDFESLIRRMKGAHKKWFAAATAVAIATVGLAWGGMIPMLIAVCLLVSDALLALLVWMLRRSACCSALPVVKPAARFLGPVVLADFALVAAPLFWLTVGGVSG